MCFIPGHINLNGQVFSIKEMKLQRWITKDIWKFMIILNLHFTGRVWGKAEEIWRVWLLSSSLQATCFEGFTRPGLSSMTFGH